MQAFLDATDLFFAWLWRASWQASVLIGLVLLSQWLLRNQLTPRWRHALWFLVVIRLALPWSLQSPVSLFNWFKAKPPPAAAVSGENVAKPVVKPTSPDNTPQNLPDAKPAPIAPKTTATVTALVSASAATPRFSWRAWLPWLWLAGVVALPSYLLITTQRLGRRVRRHRPLTNAAVLDLLEDCKQAMGVRTPLALVETPDVASPSLYGFIRPRLLLPAGLTQSFSLPELRYVFLHELGHVKRGDIPLNWLTTALLTLHWFNPLVWLAFSRMRGDRELACDALALSYAAETESQSYGRTIIKLLESFSRPAVAPGLVGILEDRNQMKQRIRMIAKFKKANRWPVLAVLAFTSLALIALTDARSESGRTPVILTGKPVADLAALRVWSCTNKEMQQVVGVSSDGRYMSYMEPGTGDLMVRDLFKGKNQHVTKTPPADVWKEYAEESLISPDGSQIAYAWCIHNDQYQLRLIRRDGTGSRLLYQNPDVTWLWPCGWSSDGHQIVAGLQLGTTLPWQYQIVLVSIRDGSVRVLKRLASDVPGGVVVSPDGRFLVYDTQAQSESKNREIKLLTVEGGQEISLAQGPWNNRSLGWSPDGRQLLFASNRRGSFDCWALRIEDGRSLGQPELVKADLGSVTPMGITRSGGLYYRTEVGAEEVQVAKLDLATGRFITRPTAIAGRYQGHDWEPHWSPDGKQLAYISTRDGSRVLCVRSMETGQEREYSPPIAYFVRPAWSADGKSIRLWSSEGGYDTWRIDLATGQVQRMNLGEYFLFQAADETVAFRHKLDVAPKQLLAKDLRSGQERVLYTFADDEGHGDRALSPNGQHLAFVCVRGEAGGWRHILNLVPAAGGEVRELIRSTKNITGFSWLPDSRQLLCCVRKELSVLSIDGKAPRRLEASLEAATMSVNPDGQQVAFVSVAHKSELWLMENAVPALSSIKGKRPRP